MHCQESFIHDVRQWGCIGAREEYSLLPMNKILVGEIHGVRRQLKLAVKLAYIYSAFVMVGVERLLCMRKCRDDR